MKIINKKATIKKEVKHQEIGGKEIILEREMFFEEAPLTIAFNNYVQRKGRVVESDKKIYYGHIKSGDFYLGYFVDDDDLEK
mgnify:CR=1 FL=1